MPNRVALWGTSLGAGHVLSVAARDRTIAAGVAQLPSMGVDPRNKSPRPASLTLRLFVRAVRDAAGARLGRPCVTMPMLGRPGEMAVFTGAEDYESMRALEAAAPEWRNAMAARSLFSLLRYKPVKLAGQVSVPLLFLAAEDDTAASMRLPNRPPGRPRTPSFAAIPAATSLPTAGKCSNGWSPTRSRSSPSAFRHARPR